MILLRGFLSSGTDGSGLELWLAESESLPEPVLKMVLLILTGGAGGLSSGSPLSHITTGCCEPYRAERAGECSGRGWQTERERGSAHISMRHGCAHALREDVPKETAEEKGSTEWYQLNLNTTSLPVWKTFVNPLKVLPPLHGALAVRDAYK